jgi:hypothetical protein
MKTYTLFLLSGVAIAGEPQSPGTLVDVDEPLAKNLLQRGKARAPTDDELRAAGRDVPELDADEGADTNPPAPPAEPPAPAPAKSGAKAKK